MAKYVYPAIFSPEETGGYSVSFPDVKGCFTSGETLAEALEMAQDALCLMLFDFEEEERDIPLPSDIKKISTQHSDELVSLITCDILEYRKLYHNPAVKKTLTVPGWLNTMAEKQGVNFSQVLQEALKEKLHVS